MTAEADTDIASAAGGKKPKLKLLIIIGGAAVLVLGAGAGFMMLSSSGQPAEAHAATDAHGAPLSAEPHSFIFNLPPMTVNLSSDGPSESFMKIAIALEVPDEATMQAIQPRMAKVVDGFQVYLRELRKSDLDGSAGIYRLKEELLRRINVAVAPSEVQAILFKEILVQ